MNPTDALGRWASDQGNLRPEPKHAPAHRIQISVTTPDGRTNTTVILRAATPPQIINIILFLTTRLHRFTQIFSLEELFI